jgi:hypothetical protein
MELKDGVSLGLIGGGSDKSRSMPGGRWFR